MNLNENGIKKARELKKTLTDIEKNLFVYLDKDASTLFIKQLDRIAQNSSSLQRME